MPRATRLNHRSSGQSRRRSSIKRPRRIFLQTELLEERWLLATDVIPAGSLVERTELGPGTISVSGEIDSFTVALDAQQTVTVVATSSAGLAPVVSLRSPANSILGTASAPGNGTAVLQTVAAATAGTYTVDVTGASGATGGYDLTLILNAAVESESFGGASNDSPATAEDLASAFITLTTVPTTTRAAAIGRLDNASVDFFSFTLLDGESASLALGAVDEGAVLDLLDATGSNLLARGVTAQNVVQSITGFVDGTADGVANSYLARITTQTAPAGAEYTLVVTRGATLRPKPT